MSGKITIFWYLSKKILTSSHFHQHLGSKRYVIKFTVRQAICTLRCMTLAQADQTLDSGDDSSPHPTLHPDSG